MFSRRFALSAVFGLTLVAITGCGGTGLIVIEEPPASIEFSLQPSETVVNAPFNTTVVFKNSLGHIMPLNDLPVKLFIETNAGGGTLLGTIETASKFGVCYFFDSLNITEVGTGYTLRAEWEDKTAVSDPFDIIPVAVGSIAFDIGPVPTPADDPFMVSVILRDQNGLFLPRDGVDVTIDIATNPWGGTLSGTTTVASVLGVCTFPGLSIDNFGPGYVLRATHSSAEGTFTALTGGFPILPPPVASLVWATQPVDTDDDATFDCVVELRDAGGTPVPVDGLQVTVAIQNNPAGGTLSGTVSELSVQGVCTFTGLNIDEAGVGYTLRATHLGFMTTSASFDIIKTFLVPTWDSNLGTSLSGGASADDSGESVSIGFNFPFYGTTNSSVYVNSNGNLTFGSLDGDFSASVGEMTSDQPRIAPWWDDLSPNNASDGVYQNAYSDRLVVTFSGIPEFSNTGSNSFQVTLWDTGRIDIVFGAMSSTDGFVGISPGGSIRTGQAFDFSATAYPSFTNVGTNFPYEDSPSVSNGDWIVFEPLGPSNDGSDGYRFTSG